MSIFYNGAIKSMPPKLLNEDKDLIVIRPFVYVQEKDLIDFAPLMNFPIIPCNLCGSQENLQRQSIKALIHRLAQTHPKIPSNMLHALSALSPSQLMDKDHWDFKGLEKNLISTCVQTEEVLC
jgi:tRNA 2-thiocytidine biosynthesis protein TtcA